uniref:Uncharacterized protein n=1 Tax=Coturnix japonica TaxID=93934 RepID=A0A8C2U9T2_COTJA
AHLKEHSQLNYFTSRKSYEMTIIKPLKDLEKHCVYFSFYFIYLFIFPSETSPMLKNDWKELGASQLKAS